MCKKREYDFYKMLAITNYNSISCGTPAETKKAAQEKKQHWDKFLKNIDWNYLTALSEARAGKATPMKMFTRLGFKPPKEKK